MSSDPAPNVPVAPGDILAGKYRVERVLGAGGMGVVVQATHVELEERVALKFLLSHAVESQEWNARFVREARAAVKIKSEHVARVIDIGRLENNAPYMVMEFLEGIDLNALLERGPIAIEDAVDYVLQACDAMAEAHAAGIVHRDLKPANLFLTTRKDGSSLVKVLDFGISKVNVPDTSEAGLTKTTGLMGSPYYMSPEQLRSARLVDHRTDVWALGVIVYELLARRPPFMAESLPSLLAAIMTEAPSPLRSHRPEISPELEQAIVRALEKDRDRRYQNVGELVRGLLPFAPRRSRYMAERIFKISGVSTGAAPESTAPPRVEPVVAASTAASPPAGPAAAAMTNATWAETKGSSTGKGRAIALGAGLGVGFLIVGAAALLTLERGDEAAPASAAEAPAVPNVEPANAAPAPSALSPPVAPVSTPAVLASASPEGSPAPDVTPTASVSPKPDKPAARPLPPKVATGQKESAPAAPAPSPTPKKNPLAIDLK